MSTKPHTQWRKIILFPCWGLQLFFELINILLLGLAIAYVNEYYHTLADWEKRVRISASINLVAILLCVGLTVTEFILFLFKKLNPLPFLIMNLIKTSIWSILWLVSLIIAILNRGGKYGRGGSVASSFLLLGFWIPLFYSGQEYRRQKRGGNLEGGGMPLDTPYGASQPYGNSQSYNSQPYNKESQLPPMTGNMPNDAGPQIQSYYAPPAENFGPPMAGTGVLPGATAGAPAANQSYYGAPPENYGAAGNAYRGVDTEESVPLTGAAAGPGVGGVAFRDDGNEMASRGELR